MLVRYFGGGIMMFVVLGMVLSTIVVMVVGFLSCMICLRCLRVWVYLLLLVVVWKVEW